MIRRIVSGAAILALGLGVISSVTTVSASPATITATGSNSATTLSVPTLDVPVGSSITVTNNGSDMLIIKATVGAPNAGSWTNAQSQACVITGLPCTVAAGGTSTFTVAQLGSIQVGSMPFYVGPSMVPPTPSVTKPGAPGKPTAVAGVGSASVTVVAPTTGSAVVTYTVTSSPDAKTCTVTVPATSCDVTGLTNGTAYSFTSTATNSAGTSDASVASDAVTPDLKPNTPAVAPEFAKKSAIAHPGVSVLLKKGVVTPSGVTATPRIRFVEYVQGLRPRGDVSPTKLGTYRVAKSGKVIANVLSSEPMTIVMVLTAPATAEYKAYRQVKTWILK